MAYDDLTAARVRAIMTGAPGLSEKRMFGGLAFFIFGNLAVGVMSDHLIVRTGPEQHAWALSQPGARPFSSTGRPMKGWAAVDLAHVQEQAALQSWVKLGVDFAATLPAK
jgi:TfoX/Sxy family transcriptional regulator of competence genes